MKEKEIRIMVDDAVALHREIATKSEQLKLIKASLVEQARLNPDSIISTRSGGKRWTAKGSDGCVARVNFPAPALVSEIESAKSVEAASAALRARVRTLKEAARHGLSKRAIPTEVGQ